MEVQAMGPLRIGIPEDMSARPLVYGLMHGGAAGVALEYHAPSELADLIEHDHLDAALIPAIESLRGVGAHMLDGPALVARGTFGGVLLVTNKTVEELKRVAVGEFCRTPVAAARIVLAELNGVRPDLCVEKNLQGQWEEHYDGIVMSGDGALRHSISATAEASAIFDLAEKWHQLTGLPLVHDVWVYNDSSLGGRLEKVLVSARNLGMQNLSKLSDGISRSAGIDSQVLYRYFAHGWEYHLTDAAKNGLRRFGELARRYDLLPDCSAESMIID